MIEYFTTAELWIGNPTKLAERAEVFLKKVFCGKKHKNCIVCAKIENKQYYNIMWLYPENKYTIEQIKKVKQQMSLALNPNEKFFFVFQKSDFLTEVTANSLLKSIEEPPHGFHFLFLSQKLEGIIPTIQSRCIIKYFERSFYAPKYETFIQNFKNPEQFIKELENSKLNEKESIEILNLMLNHWMKKYKTILLKNKKEDLKITRIIDILKEFLLYPPMPGSNKIFWKNLFLQINK